MGVPTVSPLWRCKVGLLLPPRPQCITALPRGVGLFQVHRGPCSCGCHMEILALWGGCAACERQVSVCVSGLLLHGVKTFTKRWTHPCCPTFTCLRAFAWLLSRGLPAGHRDQIMTAAGPWVSLLPLPVQGDGPPQPSLCTPALEEGLSSEDHPIVSASQPLSSCAHSLPEHGSHIMRTKVTKMAHCPKLWEGGPRVCKWHGC